MNTVHFNDADLNLVKVLDATDGLTPRRLAARPTEISRASSSRAAAWRRIASAK